VIYYIKQDNTIWGCGDPGCCGETWEQIEGSFISCDCERIELEMSEHLQVCSMYGGGPVLEWREATELEATAFQDGRGYGFEDGYDAAINFEKRMKEKKGE
jgi:hypothetical protein